MASEKVLQSLETLHRELEKLGPAIEHVETAKKIAESVKDIPQKHFELIKSVKETDENFKKEGNLSDPELRGSTLKTSPLVQKAKYDQIKLSRLVY